jgi:dihydropteroate synthase
MSWPWKLPRRDLVLGERTLVMGVLNVTPDSFSDGGRFLAPEAAVAHARAMIAEGADILDVGGESTRPGARPIGPDEERARVLPVIEALAGRIDAPISIDTRHAAVAADALAAGAEIVNDVSGLRHDPRIANVAAEAGAGLVLMHMQGVPETMQVAPRYEDLFGEIRRYFEEGLAAAESHGLPREQIVLDPGIGFGKLLEHNLALLAHPEAFRSLERPLMVGPSRKSMFRQLLGLEVGDRLEATLACVAVSAFLGVAVVRVHDVRPAVRAARVGDALRESRALRVARAATEVVH